MSFNLSEINFINNTKIDHCYEGCKLDPACAYDMLCPQLSDYIVTMGRNLIIIYLVGGWLNWWFFSHGWKYLDWHGMDPKIQKYLGDMHDYDTRLKWSLFVRDHLALALLGYIIVIVWFSYGGL